MVTVLLWSSGIIGRRRAQTTILEITGDVFRFLLRTDSDMMILLRSSPPPVGILNQMMRMTIDYGKHVMEVDRCSV